MCNYCRGCGAKLVHYEDLPKEIQDKLNPNKELLPYEYCCLCPNGCPDQRPPPENCDSIEMCCDCA